ncbi:hypothetical protein N8352_02505 [Porticoccaceae bacterium]|nr:hypothetical protein [Porticoccaceae bacterium]
MFKFANVIINTVVIRALGAFLSVSVSLLVIKFANPSNSALLFVIMSLFLLITSPFLNGIARYNVRSLSSINQKERKLFIEKNIFIQAKWSIPLALLAAIISAIYVCFTDFIIDKSTSLFLFSLFFFITLTSFLRSFSTSIMRANGKVIVGNLDGLIVRPLAMLFFAVVFYYLHKSKVIHYEYWLLFPLILSFLISYLFVGYMSDLRVNILGLPSFRVLKPAVGLFALSASEIAFNNVTLVTLGLIATPQELITVKLFFTLKIASLLCVTSSALFTPYFFSSIDINSNDKNMMFNRVRITGASIAVVQSCIIIPVLPIIVNFFPAVNGDIFEKSAIVLLILIPFIAWFYPVIERIIAKGDFEKLVKISILFNILEVIMIPIIYQNFGLAESLITCILFHLGYLSSAFFTVRH